MRDQEAYQQRLHLAEEGDLESQLYVGVSLCEDATNTTAFSKGLSLLQKAARTDGQAQYILAKVHLKKLHDETHWNEYMTQSANNGYAPAQFDLGQHYHMGVIFKQDAAKAVQWYQKAAVQNHPMAIHNLGRIYFNGLDSVPKDAEKGYQYFAKGAELNFHQSHTALGELYWKGLYVSQNIDMAIACFKRGALCNSPEAYRILGIVYNDPSIPQYDEDLAFSAMHKAMDLGDLLATYGIARMYYDGDGCDMDYQMALNYYAMAANAGLGYACVDVADMFVKGEGCVQNLDEAERWLQKAIALGEYRAGKILSIVQEMNPCSRRRTAPALQAGGNGNSVGYSLGRSTMTGDAAREQQEQLVAQHQKAKRDEAMKYARARTDDNSWSDNEMGIVFNAQGDIVQYMDTDLGIIFGADGGPAFVDSDTGIMYDTNGGGVTFYEKTLDMHHNFGKDDTSVHLGDFTVKI